MNNNNIKELSIQISLNGLSLCILNKTQNTVEHLSTQSFNEKLTPFSVLNRLKSELELSIFNQDFNAVTIIHQNELTVLVPQALYDSNLNADYLKFNNKILKTDFIATDTLNSSEIVNIYIPYININNYIFETYGEFTFKHAATVFIDSVLKNTKSTEVPVVYINVNCSTIEVLVIGSTCNLLLFNTFEYSCKEDFIYYVLFVFEQLELSTEHSKIVLSGFISEGDAFYNLLYTYVRFVSIMTTGFNFNFSNTDATLLHKHNLILNSFE